MNRSELKLTSGFYNWVDVKENTVMGEIWTNKGHRIDNANRGDRTDHGVMLKRPDCVVRKHKGKLLRKITVVVDNENREYVDYIIADYGVYPDKHQVMHTF